MQFSIVIPTYGRSEIVIEETFSALLALESELNQYVKEIFIMDQNDPPLDLPYTRINLASSSIWQPRREEYYQKKLRQWEKVKQYFLDQTQEMVENHRVKNHPAIYHIVGIRPSVTITKNLGALLATGDLLFFLDDDGSLQANALRYHHNFHSQDDFLGVLGGREVVVPNCQGRSFFKEKIAQFFKCVLTLRRFNKEEQKYKLQGKYVGRITPSSFFFCNYTLPSEKLIPVNTVRGCISSVKRRVLEEVNGFDELFQGTALREESDFCLRIEKAGYTNYYYGNSVLHHRRQVGGCNNIAKNIQTLISKFENESYFQQKHFGHLRSWYFFMRLLPMALEGFMQSNGVSLLLLFKYSFSLSKISNS